MQLADLGIAPKLKVMPGNDCLDRYTGMALHMPLSAPADCPMLSALTNVKNLMSNMGTGMDGSTGSTDSPGATQPAADASASAKPPSPSEEAFQKLLGLSESDAEVHQHGHRAPLGSAPARLLRLLRAHLLVDRCSSVLPE